MAVAFLAEVFILPATIKLLPRLFGAEALRRAASRAAVGTACSHGSVSRFVAGSGGPSCLCRGRAGVQPGVGAAGADGLRVGVSRSPAEPRRDGAARARLRGGEGRGRAARAADGVGLRRGAARGSRAGRSRDAIAEPQELNVDVPAKRFDLSGGPRRASSGAGSTSSSRPTSSTRSTCRGSSSKGAARRGCRCRSCARRVYAGDKASVEGVYVPFFRRGRFDRLDERIVAVQPRARRCRFVGSLRRADATAAQRAGRRARQRDDGRVDWSVSAYRGFRPFGICTQSRSSPTPTVDRVYPRFTMIGGDFETVAGPWVVRGEVAAFRARRVPGAGPCRRARGAIVRCRRRRRSQGGELPRQRTGPGPPRATTTPAARSHGRVADRVGGSDLRAREVPRPPVRRLQSASSARGSCAASRPRSFATMSRSRVRSAGSPARGSIRSAASPTATSSTFG